MSSLGNSNVRCIEFANYCIRNLSVDTVINGCLSKDSGSVRLGEAGVCEMLISLLQLPTCNHNLSCAFSGLQAMSGLLDDASSKIQHNSGRCSPNMSKMVTRGACSVLTALLLQYEQASEDFATLCLKLVVQFSSVGAHRVTFSNSG
jgi:hypothetical protein